MESRIVVEIDDKLKKQAQMEALKNDTTLKEIVTEALKTYLNLKKRQPDKPEKEIIIN